MLAINNRNTSTGMSPFFLTHGYHVSPIQQVIADQALHGVLEATDAEKFVQKLREGWELAQAAMATRQQEMEDQANRSRGAQERFEVGDLVWLKLKNISTPQLLKKLAWANAKYRVTKVVSPHVVELDVPTNIHPRFHVDLLKRAPNNPLPSQETDDAQPPHIEENDYGEPEFLVEQILRSRRRRIGRGFRRELLVKWVGYAEPDWRPRADFEETEALDTFEAKFGDDDDVGEPEAVNRSQDAADSQKIRWLKDSLDTPIREYVANSFPPRVFSEYLDRVVLAAEELRQRKLDAESTSGRRSGYYPSAPAAHRHPDAMDWERTRRVAPQPTRTPAARRTARWASEEERERRRRAGLCIRCGASGHFVRECPYDVPPNRNAPPARVRGVHVPTPPQLDDDLDADFGAARFELDLGGLREEVLALVVPDIYDDELLIGYPWLSHHNALIDCNRHRLVLPHFSVPRSVSTIRNLDTPTELKAARVSKILHQDLKVFAASIQDINKALEKLARENEPVTDDWKEKVPSWIDPQNVVAFDPEALYTRRLPPLRPGMS
ncbi:uncharacterized protein BROUX77_007625 [Berkeleyomyces rouxiae]|uniref:uncharacterized protein n=1 Tax=Berkeleyomyces rouxiae TaxID=2035830 RepID=UPI003B7B2EBC